MQNTSIISYFNKGGILIFPFRTPHFVIWTQHFGWTSRLNYTVIGWPLRYQKDMLMRV